MINAEIKVNLCWLKGPLMCELVNLPMSQGTIVENTVKVCFVVSFEYNIA